MRKLRFGTYLAQQRRQRNLTQIAFAAQCGIDQGHLSRLESGEIAAPGIVTLQRLAAALDMPVEALLHHYCTQSSNGTAKHNR